MPVLVPAKNVRPGTFAASLARAPVPVLVISLLMAPMRPNTENTPNPFSSTVFRSPLIVTSTRESPLREAAFPACPISPASARAQPPGAM